MHLWDENIAALRNMPNVLVTPHQAFLTHEVGRGRLTLG